MRPTAAAALGIVLLAATACSRLPRKKDGSNLVMVARLDERDLFSRVQAKGLLRAAGISSLEIGGLGDRWISVDRACEEKARAALEVDANLGRPIDGPRERAPVFPEAVAEAPERRAAAWNRTRAEWPVLLRVEQRLGSFGFVPECVSVEKRTNRVPGGPPDATEGVVRYPSGTAYWFQAYGTVLRIEQVSEARPDAQSSLPRIRDYQDNWQNEP
jgi:hypothetical protein